MKNVIFKKIKIKNFLSIGDEWVEIDYKPGINVVTGINYDKNSRNGIGKSALIADSLSFVLFGQLCRDVKKEFIGNRFTRKGSKVILSFDVFSDGVHDEYVLMRSNNPSRIQLIKNGKENITKSSIPKTTDFICKLIGATPEVFANTVIMTLNNTIPFMAQGKVDKRKFIEGILKLEVFSNMLLLARQEYNDFKREFDIESARLEDLKKTLQVYVTQQTTFETNKRNRIDELNNRKFNNIEEIKLLRPKLIESSIDADKVLENIQLLRDKESKVDTEINDVYQLIGIQETDVKHLDEQIVDLISRGNVCSKCKRMFSEQDKQVNEQEIKKLRLEKQEIEQKIITEKANLATLIATKEKCKRGIDQFSSQIEEHNLLNKENETILVRIEQLNTWNKQLIQDIKEAESEEDHFSTLINETNDRIKVLITKCAELKDKLTILDAVKFIVSEEGVKSYIVKKILKILNTKLKYYLQKFDSNCTLTFNEYFTEYLVDERGEETSYYNFSAGERKRIDLACLFTFMDIRRLQGDVSTNISVYDELFDSSLEEKGVNMALEVLKERVEKYNEAIYVVSHRPSAVKAATGDVIFLEKRNGITTKIDSNSDIAITALESI